MKLIYVAGPYRADTAWGIEQNVRRAEAAALTLNRLGVATICPHSQNRYFQGALPDEFWLEAALEALRRCDALVRLNDVHCPSKGSAEEQRCAIEWGIPDGFVMTREVEESSRVYSRVFGGHEFPLAKFLEMVKERNPR